MKGGFNRALGIAAAMLGGIAAAASSALGRVTDLFSNAYTAPDRWLPHVKRSRLGSQIKPNPNGFAARGSTRLRYRVHAPSFNNPRTLVARAAHSGAPREQHVNGESSPYPKRTLARELYRYTHGRPGDSKKRRLLEARRAKQFRLFFADNTP